MRIGLIARADRTGLAAQTWTFHKHMQPAATLVVNLSRCNGQSAEMHRYAADPNIKEWYPMGYPNPTPYPERPLEDFLDQVDVVFTAETPYNNWLFQRARQKGIRTILQPNYEFMDWIATPGLPEPDVFALPSMWNWEKIVRGLPNREIVHLPVPVDRELLPFTQRTELKTILHTAGMPAMEDRNGTLIVIEAMRHVKSPVRCVIKTQRAIDVSYPGNTVVMGAREHYWEMFEGEDLFVMPRKFGGLCLPIQEAMSTGMPVLMSDCQPQQSFLPREWLISARFTKEVMTRMMISLHETNPLALAKRIDALYENPQELQAMSRWADEWAEKNSWDTLKPLYEAVLGGDWDAYWHRSLA